MRHATVCPGDETNRCDRSGEAEPRRLGGGRGAAGLPALLVLPTLLVVFLVIGLPLIYSLALSLHRINPLTQRWIFVGLANYAKVLPDPDFIAAFGRTAYFAVITVLGGLVLGMAMALVLNMAFVGRDVLRSLVLVPWAMSPVAVGILWSWMLNGDYGTFNAILLSLGVITAPIHWLGNGAARLQPCRHRPCLEPGAAHVAADSGRPAIDARKPASRRAHRRRRRRCGAFSASHCRGCGRCCCWC